MHKIIKYFISFTAILLSILALSLWYFSPMFDPIPKPTGTYGVGIVTQEITDLTRQEIYSTNPDDKRSFVVDLYYPAAKSDTQYPFQPAILQAFKQEFAAHSSLPYFVWHMLLRNMMSYAQPNAPLAQQIKPYPVIIYLPGIGSPAINSDLEEIASWGYIIAAIYPSYDVEAVAFPNGRIIGLNPELRTYVATNDRPNIYSYRARAHKIWLADAAFTLEEIKKMNANNESIFHHMLDFDRVGILGVSHGGAVAIDFCRDNGICKAGINMDGWTKTANTNQGFDKPFMFLMSKDNIEKIEPLFANMGPQAQKILIPGAEHGIFIGTPVEKWPLSAGAQRDPYEMKHEILRYVHNFFDTHLK